MPPYNNNDPIGEREEAMNLQRVLRVIDLSIDQMEIAAVRQAKYIKDGNEDASFEEAELIAKFASIATEMLNS